MVCELYRPDRPIAFLDIWESLTADLCGKIDDKKPNRMDTADFGEITKQKIGYRLREVLNGKKVKNRAQEGTCYVYEFGKEKLERIAKKYDCKPNSVLEFSSSSASKGMPPSIDTVGSTQNTKAPVIQTNQGPPDTPSQVGKLENSRTNYALEELAAQTQGLTELTMDFGVETCCLCGTQGHLNMQVTLKDGKWGFLCQACAQKLTQKTNHTNS